MVKIVKFDNRLSEANYRNRSQQRDMGCTLCNLAYVEGTCALGE